MKPIDPKQYDSGTILSPEQAAEWFQCGPDALDRERFPYFYIGRRKRYLSDAMVEHARKLIEDAMEDAA